MKSVPRLNVVKILWAIRPEHLCQHLAENKSLLIWKKKPAIEHTQLKLVHNYALMVRVYRICRVLTPCGL